MTKRTVVGGGIRDMGKNKDTYSVYKSAKEVGSAARKGGINEWKRAVILEFGSFTGRGLMVDHVHQNEGFISPDFSHRHKTNVHC